MKRSGFAAAMMVLGGGVALAGEAKWGAHIDLEGRAGTERHLGEADLFLPLAQDDDTLLFANVRARLDSHGGGEGNFGLGMRHMLASGWNVGGYAYFDHRITARDNAFSQATLGAEALGPVFDLRANVYLPIGTTHRAVNAFNTATISGGNVIFRGGEEVALKGFDAEAGLRVPVFEDDSGAALRIFGGAYHFFSDNALVPDITGGRARVELTFDDIPHLWQGSRLSLGAEYQYDKPRGGQGFVTARLRIPLQGSARPSSVLTAQERRMADPVVRDIDVVTQSGLFGAPEIARAANGGKISLLDGASVTTTAGLNDALVDAGKGSTVIMSGIFATDSEIQIQSGQTMMGTGALTVRSASGRTAVLASGPGATINANVPVGLTGAINMADDSTLRGMIVNQAHLVGGGGGGFNGSRGIVFSGRNNVSLIDNVITVTATGGLAYGVEIDASHDVMVRGNSISATGSSGAQGVAFVIGNSSATVADNTFHAASAGPFVSYAIRAIADDAALTLRDSTGNRSTAGLCTQARSGSGSFVGGIYYTDWNLTPRICPHL